MAAKHSYPYLRKRTNTNSYKTFISNSKHYKKLKFKKNVVHVYPSWQGYLFPTQGQIVEFWLEHTALNGLMA
jgi:hypothetical protein